jgi:hypothetical protein
MLPFEKIIDLQTRLRTIATARLHYKGVADISEPILLTAKELQTIRFGLNLLQAQVAVIEAKMD